MFVTAVFVTSDSSEACANRGCKNTTYPIPARTSAASQAMPRCLEELRRSIHDPSTHALMARQRRKAHVQTTASMPNCLPSTHSSHNTVAMSKNPMACLKRSIQPPGLGNRRIHSGLHANTRYGSAMPRPAAVKTAKMVAAGWLKAKPRAAPRKGAVQGVARTVASTPLRKLPSRPSELAEPFSPWVTVAKAFMPGSRKVTTPKRLRASTKTRPVSTSTKAGD